MRASTAVAVTNGEQPGWKELLDPNRKFYIIGGSYVSTLGFPSYAESSLIPSMLYGFDSSLMNGLQSLEQWVEDFNHPIGSKLGVINATQSIGALCALLFVPYLADGIGRRFSVLLGCCILSGGALLQTFSTSFGMFIGSRFMVGYGATIAIMAGLMMISEIAYPPHRATLTSFYSSMISTGAIVAAWATFGCSRLPNSWALRLPSLTQAIPSLSQILLLWFAPDSPRWLARNGREAQALKTLAHYYADGNLQDPLVIYELAEINAAIAVDRDATRSVGWSSFVKVPGNRKRLQIIVALGFFSVMSGNGFILFYLGEIFQTVGITDPTMQLLLNGLLQVWNLIVSIAASCLVDRLGRRFLFLSSSAGMLASFIMITACSAIFAETGNKDAARAVIASIFLFMTAFYFGFLPLYSLYTIEILPLSIRAKGLAVSSFATHTFLIFNQYVNPIALRALGWKYYIFYVAVLAFELAYYYFFIIETKGMTLEETSTLFDDSTRTSSQSTGSSEAERVLSVVTSEAKSAEENLVTAWVNLPGSTKSEVSPKGTIDCTQGDLEYGRQREGVVLPREMWKTP